MEDITSVTERLLGLLFRAHPWHGVAIGREAPATVTTYIELVPSDTVKYELDKDSGLLKIDRPQKFSNVCPTLYGLIPRTLCADRVGAFCGEKTGRPGIVGDGDPLDVCVLTEKAIPHGDILLQAIPIGGLRMIDKNQADDKIVAVMRQDAVYGEWREMSDCPTSLINRLKHYFLTYKEPPASTEHTTEITHVYDREEAYEVIRRSQEDYRAKFGDLEGMLAAVLPSGVARGSASSRGMGGAPPPSRHLDVGVERDRLSPDEPGATRRPTPRPRRRG
ncbi:MAG TPA: inorganic pyrophosphatase [Candidatus Methylomirabilis sp.]|nr:inorganic pyrophosphatase [Candidatus Methylomirabilis sp.]